MPLALPLMAGPGAIRSTIVWGTRYHSISYLFGFFVAIALFALCCWDFPHGTVAGTGFTPTGISLITRIMGLFLMALGIEFLVTGIRGIPRLLINSFQMKRSCHAPFTSSLFLLVPAQLSKAKGIGKNIFSD
ncbi:MarC family protein [Shigella flexneri]